MQQFRLLSNKLYSYLFNKKNFLLFSAYLLISTITLLMPTSLLYASHLQDTETLYFTEYDNYKDETLIYLIAENIEDVKVKSPIYLPNQEDDYKNFVKAEGDNSIEQTDSLVRVIIGAGRLLIAGVATLLVLIGVAQLLLVSDKEEGITKAKTIITTAILGIALVALADDLASIIDLSGGGLLGDKTEITKRLKIFDNQVTIIMTFIRYIIGSIGILMLTVTGFQMVASGSNEEEMGKAKKNIIFILGGLFALLFVDGIVKNVLYKTPSLGSDITIDLGQGIKELVGFTNLIVGFMGPIAILMIVIGGVLYVIALGNEELQSTAKKIIITSLVGIIVIYGAFAVVSTVVNSVI